MPQEGTLCKQVPGSQAQRQQSYFQGRKVEEPVTEKASHELKSIRQIRIRF